MDKIVNMGKRRKGELSTLSQVMWVKYMRWRRQAWRRWWRKPFHAQRCILVSQYGEDYPEYTMETPSIVTAILCVSLMVYSGHRKTMREYGEKNNEWSRSPGNANEEVADKLMVQTRVFPLPMQWQDEWRLSEDRVLSEDRRVSKSPWARE